MHRAPKTQRVSVGMTILLMSGLSDRLVAAVIRLLGQARFDRNRHGFQYRLLGNLPGTQDAHFIERVRELPSAIQAYLVAAGLQGERSGQMAVTAAKEHFVEEIVDCA